MPERFTPEERSRVMRAIKSGDTTPEWVVRRIVHGLGFRYRLRCRELPGTPDLVLPRHRAVIQVHGCFWHGHPCRRGKRRPVNNADYWNAKRTRNMERDRSSVRLLRKMGWRVLTIWECQTWDEEKLTGRIAGFLSPMPNGGTETRNPNGEIRIKLE